MHTKRMHTMISSDRISSFIIRYFQLLGEYDFITSGDFCSAPANKQTQPRSLFNNCRTLMVVHVSFNGNFSQSNIIYQHATLKIGENFFFKLISFCKKSLQTLYIRNMLHLFSAYFSVDALRLKKQRVKRNF